MLKSYIFNVIRIATMVTVLRKRPRPWSQSLEKTTTMITVLIKTPDLNTVLIKNCDHGTNIQNYG